MERTIGNLGQEIWQPSNPYSNLTQEGVCWCHVNSFLAAIPKLVPSQNEIPNGAEDLGNGFVLLWKHDCHPYTPQSPSKVNATWGFLVPGNPILLIQHWAWLKLPNGQIACSLWREAIKGTDKLCFLKHIHMIFLLSVFLITINQTVYFSWPTQSRSDHNALWQSAIFHQSCILLQRWNISLSQYCAHLVVFLSRHWPTQYVIPDCGCCYVFFFVYLETPELSSNHDSSSLTLDSSSYFFWLIFTYSLLHLVLYKSTVPTLYSLS